jgi:hypothetical protein
MDEWAEKIARSMVREMRKFQEDWSFQTGKEHKTFDIALIVKDIDRGVIERIVEKFKEIFVYEFHVAVVKGSLGKGIRTCEIEYLLRFIGELESKILHAVSVILYEDAKNWKEMEKPEKRLEDTNFEYTLNRSVPVLFLWKLFWDEMEWVPERIIYKYPEVKRDLDLARSLTREILGEEIEDIVMKIMKMGSSYVNIVKGKGVFDIYGKETECVILPVSEFIDKFYEVAYDYIIRSINGEQINSSTEVLKLWEQLKDQAS